MVWRNGCFLCKMRLNITYSVLKVKWQVYNNRVIALVQGLTVVWPNHWRPRHMYLHAHVAHFSGVVNLMKIKLVLLCFFNHSLLFLNLTYRYSITIS